MPFEAHGRPSVFSLVPPVDAHKSEDHHPLTAWPTSGAGADASARALFDALDADKDGLVSAEDVALAWPRTEKGGVFFAATDNVLTVVRNLAHAGDVDGSHASGNYSSLSWPEFRAAVRLWHITGGSLPSPRTYMLRNAAECAYGSFVALAAAETARSHAGRGVSLSQMAALGGIGAVIATTLFDSNCVRPLVRPCMADAQTPSGSVPRAALHTIALASTGVLLSPLAPLSEIKLGDLAGPKAVAGLVAASFAGQAVALSVLFQKQHAQKRSAITASVAGGLAAAACGLALSRRAGQDGNEKQIIYVATALSLHAALVGVRAVRSYERGEPEPYRPSLGPLVNILSLANIMK